MGIKLSKDLVQKIRNREKLTGDDYKIALSKWNEIRKSFGIRPKTVDCCKGDQANMLKTLNNYYDSKVIEPEILKPYDDVEFTNPPGNEVKSIILNDDSNSDVKNEKFEEETLRQKADKLGLKYNKNISDKKLLIKIQEHENIK